MKLNFLFFVCGFLAIGAEDEVTESPSGEKNSKSSDEKSAGATQGQVIGNIYNTAMDVFPLSTGSEYESALDVLHCSHCILRNARRSEFCHRFCVMCVDRSKFIPSNDMVHCDVCLYATTDSAPRASCAPVCSAGQLARILTRLLNRNSQSWRAAGGVSACASGKSSNQTSALEAETPQARAELVNPSPVKDVTTKEAAHCQKNNSTDCATSAALPSVE